MTDGDPRYAGFGARLAASVLDGIVSGVLVLGVAAGFGVVLASLLTAVAAGHLDPTGDIGREGTVIVAGLALLGTAVIVAVTLVVYLLYFTLFTGWRGQTPGKMLLGLRVVNEMGQPPGMRRALMREVVGKFLSSSAFYVGFLWPLWDGRRRAWHDKIAGTFVVTGDGPVFFPDSSQTPGSLSE